MLYDSAVKYCRLAIESLNAKRLLDANNCLIRAQDIFRELRLTLNRDIPVAGNLEALYAYFIDRLLHANMKKEIEPVQEVLGFVLDLRETWRQAMKGRTDS